MKIAVMGTGGVGGYFGGLLARNDLDVTFIARGEHLKAIQDNGLQINSQNDGVFTVHNPATDNPSDLTKQDLILFTVKMFDNTPAIESIKPIVGDQTTILTLQNGVSNGYDLAEVFGNERVMIGTAMLEGRISEPGVVTQGGPGAAHFGEMYQGISERGEQLLSLFQASNWKVELQENMLDTLWKKFAYLSACASTCTASNSSMGEMRSVPETRNLILSAISEGFEVGRAYGAPISDDAMDWAISALDNFPYSGKSSMAKDFAENRSVELEGLTGTVIKMGKRLNIETPINDMLYAVLKPWAERINQQNKA
ncbi:MAG: 2-dehydropantoate 2-reductase [SAR202 cluster bacterium]|jgi:2-dehydropantoate 2-reductase|nr:2-dehydropantoate 2-reductase [SAR202 cluster bacterium]|tara:strand:- start:965 stop:1897 length:933 start_codon:yes stop_codon:yes gene_type:complete